MKQLLTAAILGIITFVGSVPAQVITTNVFDKFDGPDATKLNDAGDPLDISWYSALSAGNAALTNDPFAGGTSTTALRLSSPDTFRRMSSTFSAVTLGASNGDALTLSFDMRLASTIVNNMWGFRFGLYNSAGDSIATDNPQGTSQPTVQNNDFGYFVRFGTGSPTFITNNIVREQGYDNPTGGSATGMSELSTNVTLKISDSSIHRFALQFMRTNTTQMAVSLWYDGNLVSTGIDTVPLTNRFDSIYFAKGGVATDFVVDTVLLTTTTIPEPSTIALVAVGLLGALVVRRRNP